MFVIDDRFLHYDLFNLRCQSCAHYNPERDAKLIPVCKAFPSGIPLKIFNGQNDHSKPFPGDHGIQFAPKP